jgi:hypothetical protein
LGEIVREEKVCAGDPVHAGDKALMQETPAQRGRVLTGMIFTRPSEMKIICLPLVLLYLSTIYIDITTTILLSEISSKNKPQYWIVE